MRSFGPKTLNIYLPSTRGPNGHEFLLLVSEAGTYYRVYNFWHSKLMEAGRSLEEVYDEMKEWKHIELPSLGGWEGVDYDVEEDEIDGYFPIYKYDEANHHWVLEQEIPEPPESIWSLIISGSEYP